MLKYGPALVELFRTYPDDLVFGEAYPFNYGYQPPSPPEPRLELDVLVVPETVGTIMRSPTLNPLTTWV